jgi:very-short-patch-repair endonuclease
MPQLVGVVQATGGRDRALAWLAARQLGLATAVQLQAIGIGRAGIAGRLKRGALHRMFRGVYLVGHPVPPEGARELAGVLACRGRARVSHRSAGGWWGFLRKSNASLEVLVTDGDFRSRDGLQVHRTSRLDERDRLVCRGIPITSPARTLIDIAADAGDVELERAVAEARAQRLLKRGELEAALQRAGRCRGVSRMRAFLQTEAGPGMTRSEAERTVRRLLRDARLPQPVTNAKVCGYEVDFLWLDRRLVVEFDSFQFHGHRSAFERDRRKDMALTAAGFRVIRITWRMLVGEPLVVVATIARALGNDH